MLGTLGGRLGFPAVGVHRRFVGALGIDSVGSGIWMPVSMLYFLAETDLSLVQVGLALSISSLVTLPLVPLAGQFVDGFGAKRMLQLGNLMQAAAFALYPFAHSLGVVTAVVALSAVGRTMFYGSYGPLLTAITRPGERETWFGFLHAMRNVGFGIGGVLAGVVVSIGTDLAYHAVVLANAASYVVAWVLMRRVAAVESPSVDQTVGPVGVRAGWAVIARDRGYRWLVLCNLGYAMAEMVLNIAMPVYFVTVLGLPGWVTGAAFVINTAMIGIGQGLVVRAMTGAVRTRVVLVAVGFTALGYAAMWLASGLSRTLAVATVLVGAVIYTLGELTAGPVLGALAAESPPARLRGRYMAVVQLSWTVSSGVAPLLYAVMLAHGPAVTWGGLLVLAGLWAACCLPLHRWLPLASLTVTNRTEED